MKKEGQVSSNLFLFKNRELLTLEPELQGDLQWEQNRGREYCHLEFAPHRILHRQFSPLCLSLCDLDLSFLSNFPLECFEFFESVVFAEKI